jgi:hypothetical protein
VKGGDVSFGLAGDSSGELIRAHSRTLVPGMGRTTKGEQVERVSKRGEITAETDDSMPTSDSSCEGYTNPTYLGSAATSAFLFG